MPPPAKLQTELAPPEAIDLYLSLSQRIQSSAPDPDSPALNWRETPKTRSSSTSTEISDRSGVGVSSHSRVNLASWMLTEVTRSSHPLTTTGCGPWTRRRAAFHPAT